MLVREVRNPHRKTRKPKTPLLSQVGAAMQRETSQGATAIAIEGLTKDYGDVRAVDGLTLSISEAEVFGLLGPNG